MSDISKIKIPSGTVYEIKDSSARTDIANLKEFDSKVANIIDIENSGDTSGTLSLNMGGDEIRLIFNADKTVQWEYADALVNTSYIDKEAINIGGEVTIYGRGAGGISPYTYKMETKHSSDSNYSVLKENGETATKPWTPEKTGTYSVRINVKDSMDKSVARVLTLNVGEALVNDSTISSTDINHGSSVTLTGKASGGTSPYTYKFEAKHSAHTNYSVLQDYTFSAVKTWTPAKTGEYTVRITVKDKTGESVEKSFNLMVNAVEGDIPLNEEDLIYDDQGFI